MKAEEEAPGTVKHTQSILLASNLMAPRQIEAKRKKADSPSILGIPGAVITQRTHLVHQVLKQGQLACLLKTTQ